MKDDQGHSGSKEKTNPEDTPTPAHSHKFMRFYSYPNKLV